MTNKFNVGDKVRILNNIDSQFAEGTIGVVNGRDHSGYREWEVSFNGDLEWFDPNELELVEPTPDDSQRISKLEEEVAELKLIVAQIRKPSTVVEEALANDIIEFEGKQYKKVDREAREGDVVVFHHKGHEYSSVKTNKPYLVNHLHEGDLAHHDGVTTSPCNFRIYDWGRNENNVDVYELIVEDKLLPTITVAGETRETTHEEIAELISEPKSPNRLRAEIIEKAKNFVINYSNGEQRVPWKNGEGQWYLQNFDFIVNETKRTIVVLCKSIHGGIYERGIAKCDPSDVFNEHIGKAIALGRALGLDVSEFEQAVQPIEIVIGMQVINDSPINKENRNVEITVSEPGNGYDEEFKCGGRKGAIDSPFMKNKYTKIINDTNAIYGGVE